MEHREPIYRTDDQLGEMFDELGTWVIHGNSHVLGVTTTLRRALDKADTFASSGAVVVALARPAPHRLFIFPDQVSRLTIAFQEYESI